MVDRTGLGTVWPVWLAMAVAILIAAGAAIAGETKEEIEMSGKPGAPPPPTDTPKPSGPKPMVPDPTREDRDDYDVDDEDDDERTKPSIVSPKRAAPPRIEPVTIDGITYRQHHDHVDGIGQNSGLLAAWRPDAERPDWVIAVYPVTYREILERDVQEVYFTEMKQDGDRPVLIVTNERGARFEVDVTTRKVTTLD